MKEKKSVLLIIGLLPAIVLAGCYPSGGELLSNEDNGAISEQIEDIVSGNENLDVDVTLAENALEVPEINVKVMEWDEEKIKSIFLEGKDNLEHEEHKSEPFPNDTLHLYTEEDNYWLSYEPTYLSSTNSSSGVFGYNTLEANLNLLRLEDIFTDNEISVLSKDEAAKRCTDLLEKLGITNYSEPTVWAVKVDKANKYWKEDGYDKSTNKDGTSSFEYWSSPDDEIYLMRFPLKYNDIPVTVTRQSNRENYGDAAMFAGTYADFVVTKDDIFSLNAINIFSPEYEPGEKVKINCSAENAVKIAAEHYGSLGTDGMNYKVFNCKLVYVPHEQYNEKNFTLVPMWEIEAAHYMDDDIIGVRENLFIDAQNGNVIIW